MFKGLLLGFVLILAFQSGAQQFSLNPNPSTEKYGYSEHINYPTALTITQSTDPLNIVSGNSVSCNAGEFHNNNYYYRAFTLSDFGVNVPFNVTAVEIGIELANSTSPQPVICNLYTGAPGFPTGFPGSFSLIGSDSVGISSQSLSLYIFNVNGTVPAGEQLVVEIFTPDGQTANNSFFIGSNSAGQSAPSYVAASDCGVSIPTDVASIGFPGMHIVMSVIGTDVVPVELTSFSAFVKSNAVELKWNTASETNNQGFEVERNSGNGFVTIGFVGGSGTTTEIKNYNFIDKNINKGIYSYRLKQIDFDGTFEYLKVINVEVTAPVEFGLEQNFPNPFNPSTNISFSLAVDSKVKIYIYNLLGQQIAALFDSELTAGRHDISFDAGNLNSGVYFYKIEANGIDGQSFVSTKKMILTK